MKDIPYASTVESVMHAQIYTCSDIAYTIEKLGRYLINLGIYHWNTAKKIMLISTEDYMKSDQLQLNGYTDSIMLDVSTIGSPLQVTFSCLQEDGGLNREAIIATL